MKILVCEDEPNVASFIKKGLEEKGFRVDTVFDGETCLDRLKAKSYDLVLLDIIMPYKNGWDVCTAIRRDLKLDVPLIMLTALNSSENTVKGLNIGADDYLGKPFTMEELVARINALIRRMNNKGDILKDQLSFGPIQIDVEQKEIFIHNKPVSFTSKEYHLLEYFMRNPNKLLSREKILEAVWDIDFNISTNVVDVYVNYLRNKLEKNKVPRIIQTKIGMGYILKDVETENND